VGDIKFSVDTGLVEALKHVLPLEVFVETGTFEGDAIALVRKYFDLIHSVEISPEYYAHCQSRFKGDAAVHLHLGDSRKVVAELKKVFSGKSALFWFDAHWCVAQDTGGEKSQCPLLEEISAVGKLNDRSVIMIDDARLFASPPPQPHEISQWPRLDQVIDGLRAVSGSHELKIFNDVIVFAPRKANAALTQYMTRNTVTLLAIKDKADGYPILDAQLKEKHVEIAALKAAAVEKDVEIAELKTAANEKDAEVAALKRETDHKDVEIADLKKAADDIKAELEAECAEKDSEITELKAAANTKDSEIAALKDVCNEREALIIKLDGHVKEFQKIVKDLNALLASGMAEREELTKELAAKTKRVDHFEQMFARVPEGPAQIAQMLEDKEVHIQNIEKLLQVRERDFAEVNRLRLEAEGSLANLAGGLAHLELAKFYGRQLAEKESVIQELKRACDERESLIQRLCLEATSAGAKLHKLWLGVGAFCKLKLVEPVNDWLFRRVVEKHWMKIGILCHYDPRPIAWDKFPKPRLPVHRLPKIGLVTPSYNQATFIESTIFSVLNQNYPKLRYVVQDGGSTDGSREIIARHADRLHRWKSEPDSGQADAILRGFAQIDDLGSEDIMGWLNSDDLVGPRTLRFVAEYFVRHPKVDVVYGNRIIIDEHDREIGRWIMPPHDDKALDYIDYVPQETLFWRKRAWDRAGGLDPQFQFALDWDLLLRFCSAGFRIVRLPYLLGCFRVHPSQKTSRHIHSIGNDEMTKLRSRIHPRGIDPKMIERYARKIRFQGALCSRLAEFKVRV
jgi:GT2 family glycosyltransferase